MEDVHCRATSREPGLFWNQHLPCGWATPGRASIEAGSTSSSSRWVPTQLAELSPGPSHWHPCHPAPIFCSLRTKSFPGNPAAPQVPNEGYYLQHPATRPVIRCKIWKPGPSLGSSAYQRDAQGQCLHTFMPCSKANSLSETCWPLYLCTILTDYKLGRDIKEFTPFFPYNAVQRPSVLHPLCTPQSLLIKGHISHSTFLGELAPQCGFHARVLVKYRTHIGMYPYSEGTMPLQKPAHFIVIIF